MAHSPLISVIIPAYNQAHYLEQALTSVLQQTHSNLEVIVVDDGSTDATEDVMRNFGQRDARIKWLKQSNQGPSVARNAGIREAQGAYIALLDSDDLMEKKRLSLQLKVLEDNPSLDVVYTALQLIDALGNPLGIMRSQKWEAADFLALLFFRNLIPCPSLLLGKAQCFKQTLYNPALHHAEDYEWSLRAAHRDQFAYLDLPLTRYRRHAANLSNDLEAHRKAELSILQAYSSAHIEDVVANTSFSDEEKLLLKGRIWFKREEVQAALACFAQLDSALALFYRGNCHLRLAQTEEAQAAYQQALQKDPTNAACLNNLGVLLARQGQKEAAQQCWMKALALQPSYQDATFNINHLDSIHSWHLTWRELRPQLMAYQS